MSKIVTIPHLGAVDTTVSYGLLEGGTGGTDVTSAVKALGGVDINTMNKPFGILGLNEMGLVPASRVKNTQDITIKGPTSVAAGKTATYQITNYNVFTNYTVEAITGTVSISGDTVTWTAPNNSGLQDGFRVNGRDYVVAVMSSSSSKTTILYPTNEQSGLAMLFNVITGPFAASFKEHSTTDAQLSVSITSRSLPKLSSGTINLDPDTDMVSFSGSGFEGPKPRTFSATSSDFMRAQYASTQQNYSGSTLSFEPGTTDSDLFPTAVYVWNDVNNKIEVAMSGEPTIVEDSATGYATCTANYRNDNIGVTMAFTGTVPYTPARTGSSAPTKVIYRGAEILFPTEAAKNVDINIIGGVVKFDYDNQNSLSYKERITKRATLTVPDGVRYANITAPANCEHIQVDYDGRVFSAVKGRTVSVPTDGIRTLVIRGYFAQENASGLALVSYLTDNSLIISAKVVQVTPTVVSGSFPQGISQKEFPDNARTIAFSGYGAAGNSNTVSAKYTWDGELVLVASTGDSEATSGSTGGSSGGDI